MKFQTSNFTLQTSSRFVDRAFCFNKHRASQQSNNIRLPERSTWKLTDRSSGFKSRPVRRKPQRTGSLIQTSSSVLSNQFKTNRRVVERPYVYLGALFTSERTPIRLPARSISTTTPGKWELPSTSWYGGSAPCFVGSFQCRRSRWPTRVCSRASPALSRE